MSISGKCQSDSVRHNFSELMELGYLFDIITIYCLPCPGLQINVTCNMAKCVFSDTFLMFCVSDFRSEPGHVLCSAHVISYNAVLLAFLINVAAEHSQKSLFLWVWISAHDYMMLKQMCHSTIGVDSLHQSNEGLVQTGPSD